MLQLQRGDKTETQKTFQKDGGNGKGVKHFPKVVLVVMLKIILV